MAESSSKRRSSRFSRTASVESTDEAMTKSIKDRKPKKPKERWLLTRKTWRYMADAGKKLIPDGAHNRPEDIPKIEAYFQEVCRREASFLLWRKNSYPGALGFRSTRKGTIKRKGGSCRKATSVDEIPAKSARPKDLQLPGTSGGRFDIQKMKHDFLNKQYSPGNLQVLTENQIVPALERQDSTEKELLHTLEEYLSLPEKSQPSSYGSLTQLNHQELIDKLQLHLSTVSKSVSHPYIPPRRSSVHFEGDHVQKSLAETLSRYFSQSPNRDKVISDLLTNRKALEKLYFELRKTKGFGCNRMGTKGPQMRSFGTGYEWDKPGRTIRKNSDSLLATRAPVISIQKTAHTITYRQLGTQTNPLPPGMAAKLEQEYKKEQAAKDKEREEEERSYKTSSRRRSSVENDDVSQSVSDTIKRYLRMARKKSVDTGKQADRFKRVNYDRNLRNIKAKGEITKPGDDDGLSKGCQTNDDWILHYKDFKYDESFSDPDSYVQSSRNSIDAGVVEEHDKSTTSSPSFLQSSQSFLSHLLHGKHHHDKSIPSAATAAGAMQKSKSSSSVMHHGSRLVAKKIFRSRSKSQSRVSIHSSWTPQGSCVWSNVTGRQVVLEDTTLLQLSDVERKILQKVALAKLQALNLGVSVKVPTETTASVPQKPKRRAYLLKRKALTTGFFDAGRKDSEKEKEGGSGLVFGIPLTQCVENDRLTRSASAANAFRRDGVDEPGLGRHGSRASFTSLIDTSRDDEDPSIDVMARERRIMGSVPGLLDAISCESTADISAAVHEEEAAVPNILYACVKHLEAHGLQTLGIFRVSSSKKRVRQLREDFDCGKETSVGDDQCPHDVATLLKEYLRDLPDPLLCRELYNAFIQTQRIRNRRLQFEALQHLVQLLPSSNRDTLWTLLAFLANVARHSGDQTDLSGEFVAGNKMDSNNLATVFAPNILHCNKPGGKENMERPEDRIDVINVIRTLIDHFRQLFCVSSELLDEVYVHMMDSHPEVLDQLLNKRIGSIVGGDEYTEDVDSDCYSAPLTPTHPTSQMTIEHIAQTDSDGCNTPPEPRKTYSREECLHESAATGGPNVGMRIRYKDRERVRDRTSTKKKEDLTPRRRRDDESSGGNVTLSKLRSSSMDSNCSVQNEGADVTRVLRVSEESPCIDRRKSSPYVLDNSGIIKASLTIPVQTGNHPLSLNVDHTDIPYIEDGVGYSYSLESGKQMAGGIVKAPEAPPRTRQRSTSGSDSSVTSLQPITGTISLIQSYDSAIGSSATISSPPPYTTPSSVSSSIADVGGHSSPPSWASSPPTSPDSTHTSVSYIPDDVQSSKLIMTTKPLQKMAPATTTSKELPMLQKVSFTSTSELLQTRQAKAQDTPNTQKEAHQSSDAQKSTVIHRLVPSNPSISNIGNAVLRSKTENFERIAKTDIPVKTTPVATSNKKKYVKRRYTDSRHPTRHIPDSETLESNLENREDATSAGSVSQSGPVYKRRELISSAPSK